ncbi:efflux RND transporter periplasmic adaptor subunit [Aliiroseovarius subalbicans]|uniref:efflux RND transporter periplasmic adaptor subunit n=1 Tax=Aliiroseovarius subalbicans TaxID=2925840 RepID=UPI001F5A3AB4|nr:efflux RND transporter periplasmic adaptor subunit [Aliiroseovarius subalbicans]MCI2399223.1 efflux RND transporter periplasmic adaptor subunit [Aliiroseovarius subalbicans]
MKRPLLTALFAALLPLGAIAESEHEIHTVTVTEWKAVFGKIETRDMVPARSRLGGTLVSVDVAEGDRIEQGQQIGSVTDQKLTLQLNAMDAQLAGLAAQLENAQTELKRGEDLVQRGVTTVQRLDGLRTQVDVLTNQIEATRAQRSVIVQQAAEGAVLAPLTGVVLDVPVTAGAVVMPGEAIAVIGGGGFFLRLAVPERHAGFLKEGAEILIGGADGDTPEIGTLAKIYPSIENGRVIADVEVPDLSMEFVNARVLVRLPVGETTAIMVHDVAVNTRMGLDFVAIKRADGTVSERAVVLGQTHQIDGDTLVEIVSGLNAGDVIVQDYTAPAHAGGTDQGEGH